MMAAWGSEAIVERLAMLTARLADGLRDAGVVIPDTRVRAPHILSLGFPEGMPAGLVEQAGRREHLCRAAARPHAHQPARLQRRGGRRALRRGDARRIA